MSQTSSSLLPLSQLARLPLLTHCLRPLAARVIYLFPPRRGVLLGVPLAVCSLSTFDSTGVVCPSCTSERQAPKDLLAAAGDSSRISSKRPESGVIRHRQGYNDLVFWQVLSDAQDIVPEAAPALRKHYACSVRENTPDRSACTPPPLLGMGLPALPRELNSHVLLVARRVFPERGPTPSSWAPRCDPLAPKSLLVHCSAHCRL